MTFQYSDYWIATIVLGVILGALAVGLIVAFIKRDAVCDILLEALHRRDTARVQDIPLQEVRASMSAKKLKKLEKNAAKALTKAEAAAALLSAAHAVAAAAPKSIPTAATKNDVVDNLYDDIEAVDEFPATAPKNDPLNVGKKPEKKNTPT